MAATNHYPTMRENLYSTLAKFKEVSLHYSCFSQWCPRPQLLKICVEISSYLIVKGESRQAILSYDRSCYGSDWSCMKKDLVPCAYDTCSCLKCLNISQIIKSVQILCLSPFRFLSIYNSLSVHAKSEYYAQIDRISWLQLVYGLSTCRKVLFYFTPVRCYCTKPTNCSWISKYLVCFH